MGREKYKKPKKKKKSTELKPAGCRISGLGMEWISAVPGVGWENTEPRGELQRESGNGLRQRGNKRPLRTP